MPPRIPSWSDAVRRARAAADPSWERILAQAMADDPSGRAHLARLRFALEDHDLQAAQRLIEHPPPTPPPGWKRSVAHWQERMGREVESLQTIAAHADRQELARRAARLGDVWYAAELADPALPESYEWYWAAGTLAEQQPRPAKTEGTALIGRHRPHAGEAHEGESGEGLAANGQRHARLAAAHE